MSDDAPELGAAFFKRARPAREVMSEAAQANFAPPKMGRPKLESPKKQITLRLDQKVIDRFRALGPGWQAVMNDVLAHAVLPDVKK